MSSDQQLHRERTRRAAPIRAGFQPHVDDVIGMQVGWHPDATWISVEHDFWVGSLAGQFVGTIEKLADAYRIRDGRGTVVSPRESASATALS